MKEILREKLKNIKDPTTKYNVLREGLQHLILKILDDEGHFKDLSFIGGTALRVLFDLRRFSEDLDFSLQKPLNPHFQFSKIVEVLQKQLDVYGFSVDTKSKKQRGAVCNVFLRFKDILRELDVIQMEGQKIAVKLEIDTNPPLHARFETKLIQKDFMFSVVHHDLPTLFAGKLLAFLFRSYTKGRDIYDLVWFLGQKTPINKPFFESGLEQALKKKEEWSREALIDRLSARLKEINMADAVHDVRQFLVDTSQTRFFDAEILKKLFENVVYLNAPPPPTG